MPLASHRRVAREKKTVDLRKLPAHRSRHRKAGMQIGKEPAGVGLDLRQLEASPGVRSVHNQAGGEWACEWNRLASYRSISSSQQRHS